MSTTGCVVGTSSASQPSSPSARIASTARLAARPFALEHEAAHGGVDRRQVAVEELLRVVRLGSDVRALAELEDGLERRRPVPARARDDEAIVLRGAERLGVELAKDVRRRGCSRPRPGARDRQRPRTCSSPCGSSSPRCAGVATTTWSTSLASALSAAPVMSHVSPAKPATASSVSAVPPSCEIATSTSASGASPSTSSSACAAGPHARAAWKEVPQPVKRTRAPSGSRRSPTRSGTWRSHSGCAAMALRVKCPGTKRVYTIARSGDLREDDPRERHSRRDRAFPAGGIGLVLRHARSRLAVRDARVEGHRPLRGAHVLQGHGATPDRSHDLDRDRRDRRRVQRVHRQGAHRLLRPLRIRDARHRARRPRRHAPPLHASTRPRSRRRRA